MFSKTNIAIAAAVVAVVFLAAPAPVIAQSHAKVNTAKGGTEQENDACRRDTRRLCRHVKVEEGNDAFLMCLQEHRAKLSKACKDVLESHGL